MRKEIFITGALVFAMLHLNGDEFKQADSLKNKLSQSNQQAVFDNYVTTAEHYRQMDVDSTIMFGLAAIAYARETGNKKWEADAQRSLGISYYYFDDHKNAMRLFRDGLSTYRNINHSLGISNCYNGIGIVFEQLFELDSAEYYYNKSLEIRQQEDAQEQVAASYINIGNLYYYRSQLMIALEYYLKALSIYDKLRLTADMGDAYNSIGIVFMELKDSEKALDYFDRAAAIFENTGNNRALSSVLLNKADIYNSQLHDYDESLQLYNKSLEIKTKLNDLSGIALVYNNIGTVYGNMEEYRQALSHFEKSKQMYDQMGNQSGLIMVGHNVGHVYLARGKYDEATAYFLNSLDAAQQWGYSEYISLNYKALIQSYAAKGEFANFKTYYRLDAHITDSLLTELNQAQSSAVEADFIAGELTRENDDLKNQVDQLSRLTKSRLFIIVGLASLFVMLIVSQIIYTRVKRKRVE